MIKDEKIRKVILTVVEKIKKEYQPDKIILFGSYACGNPTEESDIDLFIIKETSKRRIDRFCEVRKIIRDLKGISVQPIVFTKDELNTRIKMADDFIMDVLEKGEVLYG